MSCTLGRAKASSVHASHYEFRQPSSPLIHASSLLKIRYRFFAGRGVEAYLYVGQERFKLAKGEVYDMLGDGGDLERKRLGDFIQRSIMKTKLEPKLPS